jgi:triacylglycerol esterase/lipase EstA (alpha/beta hydrolase family)
MPALVRAMWIVLPSVSLGLTLPGAKLPTPPVVILPGFGNAGLDYVTPLGANESVGLKAALERRGFNTVEVVPVDRTDWLRVAGGLLDADFRAGEGTPDGRAFGWYLERTGETVRKAKAKAAASGDADARVLLLGHSAGGWLARAALGDGTPESSLARLIAAEDICGLVTLGTPHLPPPEGTIAS